MGIIRAMGPLNCPVDATLMLQLLVRKILESTRL